MLVLMFGLPVGFWSQTISRLGAADSYRLAEEPLGRLTMLAVMAAEPVTRPVIGR